MALVTDIDNVLARLGRAGISGAANKITDPKLAPVVEDLRRGIAALEEVVRLLARHVRQGPEWGSGPKREFHARWSDVDANNRVSFIHGMPAAPDRFVVVLQSTELPAGTATTFGGIALVSSDREKVTFELDADAVTSESSFLVLAWLEAEVPLNPATTANELLRLQTVKPEGYVDTSNMNG